MSEAELLIENVAKKSLPLFCFTDSRYKKISCLRSGGH